MPLARHSLTTDQEVEEARDQADRTIRSRVAGARNDLIGLLAPGQAAGLVRL